MTLFNAPLRVVNGRVVSLLPTRNPAGTRQPGMTGPRPTWSLAYRAPGAGTTEMAQAQTRR
jgi:hypothetical protein